MAIRKRKSTSHGKRQRGVSQPSLDQTADIKQPAGSSARNRGVKNAPFEWRYDLDGFGGRPEEILALAEQPAGGREQNEDHG